MYSLTHGISTVFMHLYYLPIVLIGYFYRRRGIPLILGLSLAYLLLVAWFDWPSAVEIGAAALRAGMFVLTGSIVAYLSERLYARSADLESIIGGMQDIVYRADTDGNLVMASPSWAALLGYDSVEECLGKNLARDFYADPSDRETFLQELAKEGRVTGYIVRLKDRNGRPVIVSTSSHFWYGPDGKPGGVEGVFRNVTRQYQLEQDLRESEARYREFFTTSRDCVFITTPDGRWIDFNDSALDLFGYERREDLLAVPVTSIYARDGERDRVVRQIVRDGFARDVPARLKRRDGTLIDALITTVAVKNPDGSIRHFTGTVRDITEHKRVVEALQESEERFRQFFNNVNDAVYVHRILPGGRPGRIIEANDVMCLRLGYTRDELLAMEMPDLVAEDDREKMPDIAEKIRHYGHATFETVHRAKDGTRIPVEVNTHLFIQKGEQLALASARDITGLRRDAGILKESEKKFREIFDNANDAIEIIELQDDGSPGRFIDLNAVACRMLHYSREELLGMSPLDINTETFSRPYDDILEALRTVGYATFETEHRTREGTVFPVEVNTHTATLLGRNVLISVVRDITDRKRVEAALRSREQRFRNLFENMQEGLAYCRMIYDDDGRPSDFIYLAINNAFDRIIGAGTVIGKPVTEVFPGIREAFPQLFAIYGRVARTGVPESFDLDFTPAGKWLHISVYSPAKDHFTAIFTDITERKRADAALQESEEKFRNIFNSISDAVHVHGVDANGVPRRILAVNDAACAMAGYSRDELLAMSPATLITGSHARPPGDIGRDLATRGHTVFETGHLRKDGTVIPVEIHANASVLAGENVLVSVIRDIAERKKAGEALRASEHRRAMLLEAIPDIMFIIARDGTYRDFRVPGGAELAIPPDRIIGSNVRDTGLGEVVTATILDGVARALETGTMQVFEYALALPTGRHQYEARIVAVGTDEVLGIVRDITERKTAEELLRRSEEREREDRLRLANAMDLAHMANWEFNIRTGMFMFDSRFYALYGTSPEREGGTKMPADVYVREFVHPDDAAGVGRIIRETIEKKNPSAYTQAEHRIIRRDGQVRHIVVRFSVILDGNGEPVGTRGVNQDITERRQMEEALRDSERRLLDIINFLPDPTFVIDTGGKVIAWNAAIRDLTGVPPEEILGKGNFEHSVRLFGERRPLLIDMVIHPDPETIRHHYPMLQSDGTKLSGQFHVPSLLGRPADLWIVATPLYNGAGEIAGAIETIRDITEIRKTENALRDLNLTLEQRVRERTQELENARIYTRSLIEAGADPLVLIGPDGTIRDVNSAAERMTGRTRDFLTGSPFTDYVREKEMAQSGFGSVMQTGTATGNRYTILHREGSTTPVIASAALFRDSGGSVAGVFISLHDITRILADEEKIKSQLHEKEILLREVHHRVKNNLQIIVSLISLQTRTLHDRAVIEALRDTQNRVRAISLVHERLHLSKDLGTIEFGAYLRYLGTNLYAFYQKNPAEIRMSVSVKDVVLDIDTASPLGLVFNELISNMLKYAFPGGRKGECTIVAQKNGSLLVLTMQDNGIGMPADLDWKESPTLGLRLVVLLVEQLRGTITLEQGGGTKFTITIPLPEEVTGIHHVGGL
jgi:PAS domain S-box-containing protein